MRHRLAAFTYDGDQCGPASSTIDRDEVPVGSARLALTLAGYLNVAGKRPADMPLGVASDDSPFLHAGVAFAVGTYAASVDGVNGSRPMSSGTAPRWALGVVTVMIGSMTWRSGGSDVCR